MRLPGISRWPLGSVRRIQSQPLETHRVEMDIPRDFLPARIVLNHQRSEPPLEQVPVAPMALVKPNAIACVDPLHGRAEVRLGCFQQKVVVVVHQHVCVNPRPEPLAHFAKQFQEMKPVGVIPEDVLALVAASGDVMPTTRNFDSQCAGHRSQSISAGPHCQTRNVQ